MDRRNSFVRAWLLAAYLSCHALVGGAAAQPTAPQPSTSDRLQLLDHWLEVTSQKARGARIQRAVWSFIGGGLFGTSAGTAIAGGSYNDDGVSVVASGITVGVSVGLLAHGVLSLSAISSEEARYQRWHALPQVDELSFARFESELATGADTAALSRFQNGAFSLGVATAGASLLVLTPFAHFATSGEIASYITGGVVLGLGVWSAIESFAGESWPERAYRLYRAGVDPQLAAAGLRVLPMLSMNGGGVAMTGTF
jgi:hypothetical protein